MLGSVLRVETVAQGFGTEVDAGCLFGEYLVLLIESAYLQFA
jgi:hypothetical protein